MQKVSQLYSVYHFNTLNSFNCNNISQYYCHYYIFGQRNATVVGIRSM